MYLHYWFKGERLDFGSSIFTRIISCEMDF